MIYEMDLDWNVRVPTRYLNHNGQMPMSSVATSLLIQLAAYKSAEWGYFLSITEVKRVKPGHMSLFTADIEFPVTFRCRMLIPMAGEKMTGIVWYATRRGLFVKCGPMKRVFIPDGMMRGYGYVDDENDPFYMRGDGSRIEKGGLVRFEIVSAKWMGYMWRDFKVVASLVGVGFGPVSLTPLEGLNLELM